MSRDGSVESWPRRVEEGRELPADFAAVISGSFDGFPYCVRVPASRYFREVLPEQVFCLDAARLALLRRRRGSLLVRGFGLGEIEALESESRLLSSRLRIFPREGTPLSLPYNTVGEKLFRPLVRAFIDGQGEAPTPGRRLSSLATDPFEELMARDYRYHGRALELLGEEEVLAGFYHPEVSAPLSLQARRIATAYLLVATPRVLFCLSEQLAFRISRRQEHGQLTRYLPMRGGLRAEIETGQGEGLGAELRLSRGRTSFSYPLAPSEEGRLRGFLAAAGLG